MALKPEELSWTAALQLIDSLRADLAAESKRCSFWEQRAKEEQDSSDYYQEQLALAHAMLGRVVHQLSERWDSVNLTKYFPTDNLTRARFVGNAAGSDPGGTP